MLLTRRTRRNAEFCRGSGAGPSREYGWPRYSSAAGVVIVTTTSISAPNLNSRRKIPTSTGRTPHRTPGADSDALALEKAGRDAPEAVAECARCREYTALTCVRLDL